MKNKLILLLVLGLSMSSCGTNIMYLVQNHSGKEVQIKIVTDCPVYPDRDSLSAENRMVHPEEIKGWFKKPSSFFSKRIPIEFISMERCQFSSPDSSTVMIQSHCLYQDSAKLIINKMDTIYFYTNNQEINWKSPEHLSIQKSRVRLYDCYIIEIKSINP
jgi:hypothetical protein